MIAIVNKYKEPNHIYCGRGSALGNPFAMKDETQRNEVCDKYEEYFKQKVLIEKDKNMLAQLETIKEKARLGDVNLGCFCAPKRCHCETIKAYIDMQL